MPEIAAQNDVYQVKLRGSIEGQETNNIFYFRILSGAGDSDVETHLILVLLTCFVTHLLPVLASAFELKDVVWKKVYPTLGVENITIPSGTTTGGVTTDALPSYCSAVVSLRTATGGRSHRGRFYVAGAPEAATTGSTINSGGSLWTGLAAFLACLATNFIPGDPVGTNSWQQMVYSRKIGGSTFPLGNSGFTPVTSWKPVQLLGTTRSRKVGHGS